MPIGALLTWDDDRCEVMIISGENIFRDSKLGAALRHLPSGDPQVNLAWMWGALLAATMSPFHPGCDGFVTV